MVVATHPFNSSVPIAGFVDANALNLYDVSNSCDTVGRGPNRPAYDLWAHSCPLMQCGYGVMQAGHDLAYLESRFFENTWWALVLDHDNVHKNLTGYVHESDLF
ncbi:hypothetical protein [Saccharothrix sp. Mg75]|uniref:hypothetical protein n=1 Tax=Saccharothrix sp. Mg75 TaxID=3445357 RepID=UPI003EECB5C0